MHEALWMADDGISKNPGKRRHERESCINNVKLTLNCTKDYRHRANRQIDDSTYTRSKNKFVRGSLENVSGHPWGDPAFDGQSSLRRTRSLAISGENLFSSLEYQQSRQRRCQLIPRARLIDRTSVRGNRYKGLSTESLAVPQRPRRSQPAITPPDYSPPRSTYIEENRQHRTAGPELYSYVSLNNIPESTKNDSLDSNYNNKTSINSFYRVSYEDIPGLSLPNYYPDSKYDTDNTDNISITDNISSVSLDNLSKINYASFDNLDQQESISYDENIILAANKKLYEVKENPKRRTLRGPIAFQNSLGCGQEIVTKTEDVKLSEGETSGDYTETDTNLDEINLNNENITRNVQEIEESVELRHKENITFSYPDSGEHLEEEGIKVLEIIEGKEESEENFVTDPNCKYRNPIENLDNQIKTLIEVCGGEEKVIEHKDNTEEYKTIVTVDSTRGIDEKPVRKESKHHSHNYLREFLETQKGSTKPLQNFIAKKFSNLSRRNSKECSNLAENQFYSLPDITIGKNLRKCEKIDRKLRKCEKTSQLLRPRDSSKENRFIVNIGRHFDITANSSIPVDFELKIAKIPKKNKKRNNNKERSDDQLLEAVKNLKETLHSSRLNPDENQSIFKPEIVSVKTKDSNQTDCSGEMDVFYSKEELKEKLGTMRDYWNKMVGNKTHEENETCKVTELHTKVEEAKKVFEQNGRKPEEKPPSIVQKTKEIFEPKSATEKSEKISPSIKESCNYFEKNKNYFFDNDRQFESLCPTAVEIIDKNDVKTNENTINNDNIKSTKKNKTPRPVAKSRSICNSPEFDHVRYKIVKSDLFQKKIFAKCETESQFEGLMQYLQDYSFQELLLDNSIVIIEPIRSKVTYEPNKNKTMKNITHLVHRKQTPESEDKPGLNRHFFYHPVRVNKEVNDDELPNPDTVRQVRQFFEGVLNKPHSAEDLDQQKYEPNGVDPDKDRCSGTDSNSHPSNASDFGSQDDLYDSIDSEIYCEYVSEDILKKIREYGTTITYYGGRIVKKCMECKSCRRNSKGNVTDNSESYSGVKFKIIKSNSCSSRLELVGTDNVQDSKKKFIAQHKKLNKQNKRLEKSNETIKEVKENGDVSNGINNEKNCDKNIINECIKQAREEHRNQPKIIGEEKKTLEGKYVQWGELKNEKTFATIQYNGKSPQKIHDYHNYDKIKTKSKKIDDMEFEPYEVA